MNYGRHFTIYANHYSLLNFIKHKIKSLQIHFNVYQKISQKCSEQQQQQQVKLFKEKIY